MLRETRREAIKCFLYFHYLRFKTGAALKCTVDLKGYEWKENLWSKT